MRTLLFIICSLYLTSNGQFHYFNHYEVDRGLPHNSVYCIIQDSDGFIWAGTKNGLARFDGYKFSVFHTNDIDNPSRDFIESLAVDSSGTLWIGLKKGLFNFDKNKEQLIPVIDSIKNIFSIKIGYNNDLWFFTEKNIYRYNTDLKKIRSFSLDAGQNVSAICVAQKGGIWFTDSDANICWLDEKNGKIDRYNLFAHSPVPISRYIEKIIWDHKENLYIGSISQGVKKFNLIKKTYTDIAPFHHDGSKMFVHEVVQLNDNELWFGTEKGITIYNINSEKTTELTHDYTDPFSLSDNVVYSLYKDREGGIWAGTYFGGINYWPNRAINFRKYYQTFSKNSIGENAVRELCQDAKGDIWIASEDAGISRLTPSNQTFKRFTPGPTSESISHTNNHGLMIHNNELWIGTFYHGIDILDLATGKVKRRITSSNLRDSLPSDFVVTFLKTKSGKIYAGTEKGLVEYTNKHHFRDIDPNMSSRVTSLLEDRSGKIWIGTYRGLYTLERNEAILKGVQSQLDSTLKTPPITSIFEDKNGNVWVTTEGNGLWRFSGKDLHFSRYTTKNGLPSNYLFKIIEDNSGYFWVTSTAGLIRFSSTLDSIRTFTINDGLTINQFNYNSGLLAADGNLYFGSIRGLLSFNPHLSEKKAFRPPVFITQLTLLGDSSIIIPITYKEKITLPHTQSSFSLTISALGYTSPENTNYHYYLEGSSHHWIPLQKNRIISFTNLPPGTYRLRIKATNPEFLDTEEKVLQIHILPPFWKTYWAYLLYIVLGGLITYSFWTLYQQRQKTIQKKREIDSKISFFTNIAHEIKTPLTLIKGPADNLKEAIADHPGIQPDILTLEKNVDRLLLLVQQALDFQKVENYRSALEFKSLNFTELLKYCFADFLQLSHLKKINYTLETPEKDLFIDGDEETLRKIIYNLLSNATKFAATKVIVLLQPYTEGQGDIYLHFSNDGVLIPDSLKQKIFEPFFRLPQTSHHPGTGIGLSLAKSLTLLHGGELILLDNDDGLNIFVLSLPVTNNSNTI